ncbi:MAG: tRNA guanosine(34) transglycosylase Tgt [Candidatus Zambryskibacteria bacterium RIFCSPHIGHO2_12_FULL_44_12b]|uniref:Queuine tRNA-ribosyltransferase n=1 Tax=Candidatus Zambryskibacteria bacterium RIFCSPLOWO2_01_FULL_45_21 TaxID=1802761 RepID=A0A1G2U0P7_9BACT|nr:MAG: tRNA guanosine(34) transglycosylase Tgt [Candidatus Zambryskibacteria bacterium RIFCSPHIGHO2_12_FULL_44_12b]OHB03064.1 MAG: tRNA guanosine(34) transglycosylase Tgt [Candidatus Zambryskibacteria bacterium RIFCSPLOWO2_01_FULL_45_21]
MPLRFVIEKKIPRAQGRAGTLLTAHGTVKTPAFVVVGTKATIKALTPEQVRDLGAQIILANTYHLYLEPGDNLVKKAGGLHKYMNWPGPTMTDSGGFQVFSLGAAYGKELSKITKITDPSFLLSERSSDSELPRLAKIGDDGVSFRSHLDGSLHYITPEKSIEIQHNIGADIIFAFDECTSPAENLRYQEEALGRTHRWALRSLEYHKNSKNGSKQALFGIVQGGREERLRKKSAKVLSEMKSQGGSSFDGFGIGGSFAKEDMSTAVKWVNETLPEEKPRHLLGIGEPEDLFLGVENGIDLFDCVAPTRNGRTGTLYTRKGKINITNKQFQNDFSAIEEKCDCYTCRNYSRGYVSHLFKAKEMLAATLGSIHNLRFIISLVEEMRKSILTDSFFGFKKDFLSEYLR